ncbi:MAG: endonuclease MutS2 [Ignavibacteria bacterium]|nr:endonuclease MutS2 [Ignavibacteria bacterium]
MTADIQLDKLEFKKVLSAIEKFCYTVRGKQIIRSLTPFANNITAIKEGHLVSEAKHLLNLLHYPPLENIDDLSEELGLSRIDGSVLPAQKILQILRLAVCSRNLVQFIKQHSDEAPGLTEFLPVLFIDKVFENAIQSVLDENGEVKDSASRELARIRVEIREKSFHLRKLVNKIARDLSDEDVLREEYLTLRDGRMVVPIRVEHKRHIRGFIHSESASGQTVYLEPEETLNLNNEIVTLTFAEKREIEKILRQLTRRIGEVSRDLTASLEILAYIDSLFGRAHYSGEINGSYPQINDRQPFEVLDARHPLLYQKLGRENTIPINVKLDKDRVVIITGPNAGGKTVVLKTVGLLTLMVYSGIHIPASPDSTFHTFTRLFIDIGDEQSLEEDLSTFSSHLSHIKQILSESDSQTLVLLDELGTGTDPIAGAALGTATLMRLRDIGCITFATTHHGSLKTLAQAYDGFENAAMEFDTSRLVPTYHFKLGLPGSSYAFEIAARLGFTAEFLDLATSFLEKDEHRLEESLLQIERLEQDLKKRQNDFEKENSRLQGLVQVHQRKIAEIEREKKDILRHTKDEGKAFIHEANRELEKIIKELRESSADAEHVRNSKIFLKKVADKTERIAPAKKEPVSLEFVAEVGKAVRIKETGTIGTIIEVYADKSSVKILAGAIPIIVESGKLEPVTKNKTESAKQNVHFTNSNHIQYRIDIRGKRPEEIEYQVIKFLDEAYSSGMDRVEILHGKGTGVLKKMVKDVLKDHLGVKNSYFAPVEYGGEGVTIVEMKN